MDNYDALKEKRKKCSLINLLLFILLIICAGISIRYILAVIPLVIIALIISNNKCIVSDIDKKLITIEKDDKKYNRSDNSINS